MVACNWYVGRVARQKQDSENEPAVRFYSSREKVKWFVLGRLCPNRTSPWSI